MSARFTPRVTHHPTGVVEKEHIFFWYARISLSYEFAIPHDDTQMKHTHRPIDVGSLLLVSQRTTAEDSQYIHTAKKIEYLTLSCERVSFNGNANLRIEVGHRDHALLVSPGPRCLENFPIYEGEEVWVAIAKNDVQTLEIVSSEKVEVCVHGYVTSEPA